MKRSRSLYSDDGDGDEVQSLSVSNYHLVDEEDNFVSFAVLPIQWSDSENSGAVGNEMVFVHGDTDNGMSKIFVQVTAWRFDLSNVRPEVSLLSKDGRWIKLQKPWKKFQGTIRTVLVTLHFLHRVKKKRQLSVVSVLQDLTKDEELSSYSLKPSQNDLLDHVPLIGEAAKRDAFLVKSKLLLMVLEKSKSQKLLDKEVNDLARPGLTVVGNDSDMIDESNEKDDLDVCALCDNGGNVTCCDGVCMRSFHATKEAGRENNCVSLGFTQKEVDEIQSFYCKNCEYHHHQCFACGKLGSSDKVKGAEVIKCASATCERFYHPCCVAKLLPQIVKHAADELERNIADGDPFTCPLHYCCVCKELENKRDPELQFAVCRRCPKSYHRKCLPREIALDNKNGKDTILRAWEGLLPNNRVLIYCLNHEIDRKLGTPVRDHIKFPHMKAAISKINAANSKINAAKGSKSTGKLSSNKFGSKKSNKRSVSKKIGMPNSEQNRNQLIRKLSTELPSLDADSEKSLLALFKEARSSITLESVLEKHTLASTHTHSLKNVVEKTITMEKVKHSVDAVQTGLRKLEGGCSIQDVQAVCDPGVLKQIFKWKDKLKIYLAPVLYGNCYTSYGRHFTQVEKLEGIADKLHWYVQNGDTIVDFSCGANDFSILMKKKLEETEKKCSYRNYDLLPTKNDFSFERRDWMTVQPTELPTGSQLIMGLNPTAELANEFINKALEFKPKLLILIVPPETERLDKKQLPYDLIWEDENFLSGMSFYLPGSIDVNDRQMDHSNVTPPLLSLWSRPDWTTKHKVIAQEHGHVCSQHQVLEKESLNTDLAVDHTADGTCADNFKSADDQEHQASTSKGQKRSLHCGNVDKERQEGQKSRIGKSGKSPRNRKRNTTQVGVVSPAKRQAVEDMSDGVPYHSQRNPINGTSSGEGLQPDSDVACPRVEVGDDPSCSRLANNNEQEVSVTESSCKTNTAAIRQEEPPQAELCHVKRSSLGSESLTFCKSGSLGRSVPKPGYGRGLNGFAPGPHYVYASQHSCGWLDE